MRRIFTNTLAITLIFSILIKSNPAVSQIVEPVKWTFSIKKTSDDQAELLFSATIENGWHLYSQYIPEGGPISTFFSIDDSKDYKKIGKVIEPKPEEEDDPIFKMVLKYFSHKAVFKQKIQLLSDKETTIKGFVEFMCCDDKRCIPPEEVNFEIKVPGKTAPSGDTATSAINDTANQVDTSTAISVATDSLPTDSAGNGTAVIVADETAQYDDMSLWAFFLAAFAGGLIALLTPCIYPMIPMTVTYFLHSAGNKRKSITSALVYGISIIVIYVLIGTVVSVFLGEQFTNFLSTHWIPNVFFFILFIVFGASFLGMFEITLPSWMVNKTDKQADRGGYLGAFFMAFTLVLVSFSCTAPVVGSILAFSTQGMVIKPIIGMLGYSLAFALPFTMFAIFPTALQSLPKSGGWLNSVKVVLGFIELALALKFLSMADQTYHWGILDREIYIAAWIVIFFLMGVYLLGKLKFSHDSDLKYLPVPRLLLAIVTFSFVVYLIPGMFGAPLKALAGWLPPQTTHDFDLQKIVRENAFMVQDAFYESGAKSNVANASGNATCEPAKYSDALHLEHGLKGYFDIDQAIACAKAQNKPLFVDFTGHACVNCREMESYVWSDSQVLKRLRNNFVVVALYVDDKKIELPENEWYTSTYDGKVKKTLGDKNFDFQKTRFNANAQPYYVLLDHNMELLVPPRTYNLDVPAFVEFLDNGVREFNKRQGK
ncbi:MAG: thioredoxin family protein [Bacteroidetes bacterium]|nr:thioredoxin family protein [Bacteroidota bacterium]MBU1718343.1 thioredoxin family protein [Bacteroidota bacterium]